MKPLLINTQSFDLNELKQNDYVLLSGTMYSARDLAHQKLLKLIQEGESLPIDLKNQAIYYMGPTPARKGAVSGAAGPTTSSRMDQYVESLLKQGIRLMVGKGRRSEEVNQLIKAYDSLYIGTVGGAGAYLGDRITAMECAAFPELGPEAIYRLEIRDLPGFVMVK